MMMVVVDKKEKKLKSRKFLVTIIELSEWLGTRLDLHHLAILQNV